MARIPSTWSQNAQRFSTGAVRLFHDYANWLVSISWKRFVVLSLLLLIAAAILESLPPFSASTTEVVSSDWPEITLPSPPKAPRAPRVAGKSGDAASTPTDDDTEILISIDKHGVRITPRARAAKAAATAASAASAADLAMSSAASAASRIAEAASASESESLVIRVPSGVASEDVKDALREARDAVQQAIDDARQAKADAAEAANDAAETAKAVKESAHHMRTRTVHGGVPLGNLAMVFIIGSAILKGSYKGRIQAEVKAAAATETAESEQLKRQVVEARMAAMQAQVEPHFLFNTLASIDHLIETDPARASQMQKNLIALLRASMPTLRESQPSAHNLGREMAVIRPYLEILKVRMEERLQTDIQVPDGLLSAEFPSMMIQSLVENAIKHGLEPKAEGGRLTVKAEIVHGKLAVTVADTGLGFGKAATAGTGTGLNNIRERLKLLHGNKGSMTISENSPSGTVVTLTVPYLAQPQEGATA